MYSNLSLIMMSGQERIQMMESTSDLTMNQSLTSGSITGQFSLKKNFKVQLTIPTPKLIVQRFTKLSILLIWYPFSEII